jgi:cell division septal protein FtsQ
LAKKKKFKFKLRYILIILIVYFLFKALIAILPIEEAQISYLRDISEAKKSEAGEIVKKVGLDNLRELKSSIESLGWVESVSLKKNILGRLKIQVEPRLPVVKVAGLGGKVVDDEGFVFEAESPDSLPEVEAEKGVTREEISEAIKIFKIVKSFKIDRLRIKSGEVITRCSNFEVRWGNSDFEKKNKILERLLHEDKNNQFKGTLDFRFKNMVILRR